MRRPGRYISGQESIYGGHPDMQQIHYPLWENVIVRGNSYAGQNNAG
jgi:hypothetical protein